MSPLDIILLTIIAAAVIGALRYIIKKKKSGGCVGCSGCSKTCPSREKCCGTNKIDSSSIHIKRATL